MKLRPTFLFLFAFTATFGAIDRASQIDDICEATFRYQFTKNGSALQQNAKVYFLSLYDPEKKKGKDPSDDFMRRFSGHKPRIAKASESKSSMNERVRDKKTGEQGLVFSVNAIRWKSDDEVEVDGGYYEASLSSSGNTYSLKKKDGKWVVVNDVMHWISRNRAIKAVKLRILM